MDKRTITSHQLAQLMLSQPDLPIVVGRDRGIYQAGPAEMRETKDGKILLSNQDKRWRDAKPFQAFWISGPFV